MEIQELIAKIEGGLGGMKRYGSSYGGDYLDAVDGSFELVALGDYKLHPDHYNGHEWDSQDGSVIMTVDGVGFIPARQYLDATLDNMEKTRAAGCDMVILDDSGGYIVAAVGGGSVSITTDTLEWDVIERVCAKIDLPPPVPKAILSGAVSVAKAIAEITGCDPDALGRYLSRHKHLHSFKMLGGRMTAITKNLHITNRDDDDLSARLPPYTLCLKWCADGISPEHSIYLKGNDHPHTFGDARMCVGDLPQHLGRCKGSPIVQLELLIACIQTYNQDSPADRGCAEELGIHIE